MNRVKCPACGKGWDKTGEGCCDFCVRKPLRPVNGQPEDDDLIMWPARRRKENDANPSK